MTTLCCGRSAFLNAVFGRLIGFDFVGHLQRRLNLLIACSPSGTRRAGSAPSSRRRCWSSRPSCRDAWPRLLDGPWLERRRRGLWRSAAGGTDRFRTGGGATTGGASVTLAVVAGRRAPHAAKAVVVGNGTTAGWVCETQCDRRKRCCSRCRHGARDWSRRMGRLGRLAGMLNTISRRNNRRTIRTNCRACRTGRNRSAASFPPDATCRRRSPWTNRIDSTTPRRRQTNTASSSRPGRRIPTPLRSAGDTLFSLGLKATGSRPWRRSR